MKYLILAFAFFMLPIVGLLSNDSVLKSSGSTLVPTTETNIELRKEILTLKLVEGKMLVDVHFEFYNPTEEQTLTVGFITPPMHSPDDLDNNDLANRDPEIFDFSVNINDSIVDFGKTILLDSEYDFLKSQSLGNTFIYFFEATFKPGFNTIKHTYIYTGGFDSSGNNFYNYILTTGTYWGNKKIDDFYLKLDLGHNSYFSLANFLKTQNQLNWKINGIGKNEKFEFYIRDGYLEFYAIDYIPTQDISIYVYNSFCDRSSKEHQHMYNADESVLQELDKSTLRILRNNFFATKGYKFQSEELLNHYQQYVWYIPDEDILSEDIYSNFSPEIQQRISLIQKIEDSKN